MSAHRHEPADDRRDGVPDAVERAEAGIDDRTEPLGGRPRGLEGAGPTPSVEDLRQQQQREMRHTGLGTSAQFHGALAGTAVGGVLGAALGLLVGWLALSDLDTALRFVLPLILGAAAGAVIGFVYLGGRMPELENETTTAEGRPQIGSSPRDPGMDERGRPE